MGISYRSARARHSLQFSQRVRVSDLGVLRGIPNWTDRQISEKKERTKLLTEDVSCVTPLPLEPNPRFRRRDTWWMTSIQRPESCPVI